MSDKEEISKELRQAVDESITQILAALVGHYSSTIGEQDINVVFAESLIEQLYAILSMISLDTRSILVEIVEELNNKMVLSDKDLELYNLPVKGEA